MGHLKPRVRYIEDKDWVNRDIKLSFFQEYNRQTAHGYVMDKHWISVNITRNLKGKYELVDGSTGTFDENPHVIPTRYFLAFDTNLNFREVIKLLGDLDFTLNTRIRTLHFQGDETYNVLGLEAHRHPITFSELNSDLVELVMGYDLITLELMTRPKSEWGEVDILYKQTKQKVPSDERIMNRLIRYSDTKIQQPRFGQIFSAAALDLKPEEKKMLEDVVMQSLQL